MTLPDSVRSILLWASRRLPVSSEVFGPPKAFCASAREWVGRAPERAALYHEIVPPHHFTRVPPVTLTGATPWQFHAFYGGLEGTDPASFVLELPEGRVIGRGAVIAPDDTFLGDVSREFIVGGDQTKHSIFKRIRLGKPRVIDGSLAVLAATDTDGYWHWSFDILTRILLLREYLGSLDAVDYFLLNPLNHGFQRETLERLGLPMNRILYSGSGVHLKARRLIVPSVFGSVPNRWACEQLGVALGCPEPPSVEPQRLYISRSDARVRRAVNEDELVPWLKANGFKVLRLQGMTVEEQCRHFSSAEAVVAPHGAGLTNLIFAPSGTKVVEIYPPTWVNPCYWVLAGHRQHQYACVEGDGFRPPDPPSGIDPKDWYHRFVSGDPVLGKDLKINVEKTIATIGMLIGAPHPDSAHQVSAPQSSPAR